MHVEEMLDALLARAMGKNWGGIWMSGSPTPIRVLIADNNVELCESLGTYIGNQPDMELCDVAVDGEEALEKVTQHEPDVMILDITMPHLDGLAVLEQLDSLGLARRPKVLVLTAFGREDVIRRFTELGADYFIVKPVKLDLLGRRIRQFGRDGFSFEGEGERRYPKHGHSSAGEVRERPVPYETTVNRAASDLESAVTQMLHDMGVPAHFKGYNYLRDAVMMVLRQDKLLGGSLTKELYPELAEKYRSTPGGVEAAIRNAVIAAWENGNREFLQELTGRVGRRNRFPTNSLIIAKLADQVRLHSPAAAQLSSNRQLRMASL